MKQIFDFILLHWETFASIILVIASIVLALLRKKPVLNEVDNILIQVLERLPGWICDAEVIKGAQEKKALVIASVRKFVKDQFSVNLPDSFYISLGQYIEIILSTPQKH